MGLGKVWRGPSKAAEDFAGTHYTLKRVHYLLIGSKSSTGNLIGPSQDTCRVQRLACIPMGAYEARWLATHVASYLEVLCC